VTESTNSDVRALAVEGAPHGTSVVAAEQTAGRGRHGRRWVSDPKAGLWCSVLLRGSVVGESLPRIPLLAALAVVDAVRNFGGFSLDIKWPNDVLSADGRKLAGILVEATWDFAVLGIGMNVDSSPTGVQEKTCCLADLGVNPDRSELLAAVLVALHDRMAEPWEKNLSDYRQVCRTLGSNIQVTLPGGQLVNGVGLDVDSEGHLLVKTGQTVQTIVAGDVLHATIAP
jgi:BirA family biotin operon repressor/biotin-[acetyl-CoA-carboxylase] ligase